MRRMNEVKPAVAYLAMFCLALIGALSNRFPSDLQVPTATDILLLIGTVAIVMLIGVALYLVRLDFIVRGLELLTASVLIFLGTNAHRPASEDITFFCFVGVILGICIVTPPLKEVES